MDSKINSDTIKLLRECDSGIKMGVGAIDDVMEHTSDQRFRDKLAKCRSEHKTLEKKTVELLDKYHDNGKDPNPMAKGMSWIKTNMKLAADGSDKTVAELITDGCNMGVKSLNRFLNQYEAADEVSKDITKRLINLEEKLAVDIRCYL